MKKGMNSTERVLEALNKKPSEKKSWKNIFLLFIVIIVFFIIFFLYFYNQEKLLESETNIEDISISKDGQIAYIKLKEGDENITKIKIIFKDTKGNEFYYEVARKEWDYEINALEIGLENFDNIEEVDVVFEYGTGEEIDTKELTTKSRPSTGGGGSGGGSSGEECTPDKDCSYYYGLGQCGSLLSDGCNNVLDCNTCTDGIVCTDDVCLSGTCDNIANDSLCALSEICDIQQGCVQITKNHTNNLSQFGITWYFDKKYEYGQFANGDYWVIGSVEIIGINPASVENVTSGRIKNGAMINPSPSAYGQGYDNSMGNNFYNSSLNAAFNVSAGNPLRLFPSSSLVSVISKEAAGYRPQLETAAILTVLSTAPADGSFRPPYSGTNKTIKFNKQIMDYSLLEKLSPVSNTPSLSTVERYFERPWIDHKPGYTARYQHPSLNMPDYGREISNTIGIGAVMLHINFTDSEKETLLTRYVQLGIDLFGVVQDGGIRNWCSNGGHHQGRKWPIMFAGFILNNTEMKSIGSKSGDYLYTRTPPDIRPSDYICFGEDTQTFYVKNEDLFSTPYNIDTYKVRYSTGSVNVENGNSTVEGVGTTWTGVSVPGYFAITDDNRAYDKYGKAYIVKSVIDDTHLELNETYDGATSGGKSYVLGDMVCYGHCNDDKYQDFTEYTAIDLGLPEWGIEHDFNKRSDGLEWNAAYRRCCTANSFAGYILAAQIMEEKTGSKTLWNHNVLFDYQDRYMEIEAALGNTGSWIRQWSEFTETMWGTYRADYGCVWTRNNKEDDFSQGYYNCSGCLNGACNLSIMRVDSLPLTAEILFVSNRDTGTRRREIYSMDANGGNQTRITFTNKHHSITGIDSSRRYLVTSLAEEDTNSPSGLGDEDEKTLWIIDLETKQETCLTPVENDASGDSFSPDSEWIVFMMTVKGEEQPDIYKIKKDGTELTKLTNTNTALEGDPEWANNGDEIIFAYLDGLAENPRFVIQTMDVNGGI